MKMDIVVTLNEKFSELGADNRKAESRLKNWLNLILVQTPDESRRKKELCEVCDCKKPLNDLQLHHIAGRKHDDRTITACETCHSTLSNLQKLRDFRWWHEEQPQTLKDAFFLQGIFDLLVLKSEKTSNSLYRDFANKLIEDIAKLLNSAI